MSTRGRVAQKPTANPAGSSLFVQWSKPGTGGPPSRAARRPRRSMTPVSGTLANAVNSSVDARSHAEVGSPGGAMLSPTIAEATADVVSAGADRVHICTARPRSASRTAIVSPMTPTPTTTTSGRSPSTMIKILSMRRSNTRRNDRCRRAGCRGRRSSSHRRVFSASSPSGRDEIILHDRPDLEREGQLREHRLGLLDHSREFGGSVDIPAGPMPDEVCRDQIFGGVGGSVS